MMSKEKKEMMQIVWMALLLVVIIILVWTTLTLIKNKEIIQKDPLRYGMEVHGFISCQCFDEQGVEWYSKGEGFINQQQAGYGGEWFGPG